MRTIDLQQPDSINSPKRQEVPAQAWAVQIEPIQFTEDSAHERNPITQGLNATTITSSDPTWQVETSGLWVV